MDDIERAAIAAEGYEPDDPAVVAALARVSAVLAALGTRSETIRRVDAPTCQQPALTSA
jgi:hypothetical protein